MLEINVNNDNALGYIEIKYPKLKLLIDTGASKSFLNPDIIYTYFKNKIFEQPVSIKSVHKTELAKFQVEIPAFPEFNSCEKICFVSHKFHDFFDGLIGLPDLEKLNLIIDLKNRKLFNKNPILPILHFHRNKHVENNNYSLMEISGLTSQIIRVPVDKENGDILINETKINSNLIIPPQLTKAKRNFASVEIRNITEQISHFHRDKVIRTNEFVEIETAEANFLQNNDQNLEKFPVTTYQQVKELIRTSHLNDLETREIIKLCGKFLDILQTKDKLLTFTSKAKHEIKTSDEMPIYTKTYRYPFIHRAEIQKQIEEMIKNNVIRPSDSPWSSPVWIVGKKADASKQQKWRMVIDYRKLNEKTLGEKYPLPNITDILDKLGKASYFSVLDLASGFHQIEMHPNSISKTAFTVDNGHYEFTRMPFGLKNAPATFQRAMDDVLKELQNKICLVYMDDTRIIIFSSSLDEHITNLQKVFQQLRKHNLKIQLDKCEFLCKEVQFLGHVVTPEGIKPNPDKLEIIKNFPIPRTKKEIK